ncbi:hypothetical protein ACFPTR_01920 [Aliibacillus thermotolerans]|uniref:Uncharacterized protein n=1 Tax=Aliibacillus thermotolerans TaxID=1834418 RepID=A0ABW0U488_9BACI|nr:hypothetical protein [Aliibacillus thermotolerans]MDA3130021.1 hypothetical protein [Aliibacillus thermotolerans]
MKVDASSYTTAHLTKEQLEQIRALEKELQRDGEEKIVLIAYEETK